MTYTEKVPHYGDVITKLTPSSTRATVLLHTADQPYFGSNVVGKFERTGIMAAEQGRVFTGRHFTSK
jgi:hypothetical protein